MRYILGRNSISQPFTTTELVDVNSIIDCGELKFEFIDDSGEPVDDELFEI